jgi:hypothetical protein
LADNKDDVVSAVNGAAVYLWAHNRKITYEYTGEQLDTKPYCNIAPGSIIVDPWRKLTSSDSVKVIHYGNTRGH